MGKWDLAEQCGAGGRSQHVPVVHHEFLHGQESVVANLLVFVVHVVHHQLLPTKLFNNPEEQKPLCEDVAITSKLMLVTQQKTQISQCQGIFKNKSYNIVM